VANLAFSTATFEENGVLSDTGFDFPTLGSEFYSGHVLHPA
jgi:hypothetical protein